MRQTVAIYVYCVCRALGGKTRQSLNQTADNLHPKTRAGEEVGNPDMQCPTSKERVQVEIPDTHDHVCTIGCNEGKAPHDQTLAKYFFLSIQTVAVCTLFDI